MNVTTQFTTCITSELDDFRKHFDDVLSHPDPLLGRALTFIRQRDGKRVRPVLLMLVAKALGGVNKVTLHCATTLELLHTASLVHDDIVDESKERRGQASVNASFGNKVAVLVGDYLLSLALQESARTGSIDIVSVIAELGKTLSQGEVYQLETVSTESLSEDAYFRIIHEKTGALFEACTRLGVVAAGASETSLTDMQRLGFIVGNCFQIRDDIFDYFTDEKVGKPTGNDMQEGKLTLPVLYALRTSGTLEMHDCAMRVKHGTATADDIHALVAFTHEAGGIDYARSVMREMSSEGHQLIDKLPLSDARDALHVYVDYMVGRDL